MSIEEKAKAYDEALERFKSFKEKYYTKSIYLGDILFDKTGEMQKDFESIFPQLNESEDERMRRKTINCLNEKVPSRIYLGSRYEFIRTDIILKEIERLKKAQEVSEDRDYAQYELDTACGYDMACNDILSFLKLFAEVDKHPKNILAPSKECDHGLREPLEGENEQKEDKEELVYRLNGLMQDYIKEGKNDEEKEHRLKCYHLFWNALEDASFFEQIEEQITTLWDAISNLKHDGYKHVEELISLYEQLKNL